MPEKPEEPREDWDWVYDWNWGIEPEKPGYWQRKKVLARTFLFTIMMRLRYIAWWFRRQ